MREPCAVCDEVRGCICDCHYDMEQDGDYSQSDCLCRCHY